MLTPNAYDITVTVKEVPYKGKVQPMVYFTCKCGNSNMTHKEGDPEPFQDFIRQELVTPDPQNYPHRTKLVKYKVAECRKCKAEIPHQVVGQEAQRQIRLLAAKKDQK